MEGRAKGVKGGPEPLESRGFAIRGRAGLDRDDSGGAGLPRPMEGDGEG